MNRGNDSGPIRLKLSTKVHRSIVGNCRLTSERKLNKPAEDCNIY